MIVSFHNGRTVEILATGQTSWRRFGLAVRLFIPLGFVLAVSFFAPHGEVRPMDFNEASTCYGPTHSNPTTHDHAQAEDELSVLGICVHIDEVNAR